MIIVTGLRRSGTSMMMLALKESGIPIIAKDMADEHNPLGYWETQDVTRGIFYDMGDKAIKIVADGFYFSDPKYIDKVIVMLRDPRIVLKSQLKVGICRKGDEKRVAFKNAVDLSRTFEIIKTFKIPHITVEYDEMLRYPKENMLRVCRFLGKGNGEGWKIVDPKLNNH